MNKKQLEELDNVHPLVMAEEFWANSQFSLARYYGKAIINGNSYVIVTSLSSSTRRARTYLSVPMKLKWQVVRKLSSLVNLVTCALKNLCLCTDGLAVTSC